MGLQWPSYNTFVVAVGVGLAFIGLVQGIYLSFRVLNFPDLTVSGSISLGGIISVILFNNYGWSPLATIPLAFLGGAIAGMTTGLLTTKFRINGLLASILVTTALYSINLILLDLGSPGGKAGGFLYLDNERYDKAGLPTLLGFLHLRENERFVLVVLLVNIVIAVLLWALLSTQLGLAVRATGNNEQMARAVGIDTDAMKMLGLGLANGLVAIAGVFAAQQAKLGDASSGQSAIVIGLAGLILGEAFIRSKLLGWTIVGTLVGSVVYRVAIALVLAQNINVNYTQLATALLVFLALTLPLLRRRLPTLRRATSPTAMDGGKVEPNKVEG